MKMDSKMRMLKRRIKHALLSKVCKAIKEKYECYYMLAEEIAYLDEARGMRRALEIMKRTINLPLLPSEEGIYYF